MMHIVDTDVVCSHDITILLPTVFSLYKSSLSITANADTSTSESTESCITCRRIAVVIECLSCSRWLGGLRISHSISIIQIHHAGIAPRCTPWIITHTVQLEHQTVHEARGLDQVIAVGVGQDRFQVDVSVTGRDANQVIEWVTSCKEVEGHEDPGQVAALHWEAPDRDLHVGHQL